MSKLIKNDVDGVQLSSFRVQSEIIKSQTSFLENSKNSKFEGIEDLVYDFIYFISNSTHNKNLWGEIDIDVMEFCDFLNYTPKHLKRKASSYLKDKYDEQAGSETNHVSIDSPTLFQYMMLKLGGGIPVKRDGEDKYDFIRVISSLERTFKVVEGKKRELFKVVISDEFKKQSISKFILVNKNSISVLRENKSNLTHLYLYIKQIKSALFYRLINEEKSISNIIGKELIGNANYSVLFKKANRSSNLSLKDVDNATDMSLEDAESILNRKQFKNKKDSLIRTFKKINEKLSLTEENYVVWTKATNNEVLEKNGFYNKSCYYFKFTITAEDIEEYSQENKKSFDFFINYMQNNLKEKVLNTLGESTDFYKWMGHEKNRATIEFDIRHQYKETFNRKVKKTFLYTVYEKLSGVSLKSSQKLLEHQEAYERILVELSSLIEQKDVDTYFKPLLPIKLESGVLSLQSPSTFIIGKIEDNFFNELKTSARKVLGPKGYIEYLVNKTK